MSQIFRFGPFELDADRQELRRCGVIVHVEPKPLEVLAELLRHAGELVTKNELMDSVWANRVVTDSVVSRCIKKLRDVLDEDGQSPILSVHGYGYRFVGAVDAVHAPVTAVPLDSAPPRPQAGDEPPLRPHWRLVRPLDERASVWLAQHIKTGETHVFKYGFDPSLVPALRREVVIHRLLLASLGERDDIARLLDYNLATPPYFLETAYCPHGNLADWCRAQGGVEQIPLVTRLELVRQAAHALAAAHEVGVLHMDIKPSNLLVWTDAEGAPRVRWADFGSARLTGTQRLAQLGITHVGTTQNWTGPQTLHGTVHYIAPERLRGEAPTIRSDLYAMGVMLYQLSAGDLTRPLAIGWERHIADELLREDIAATANDDPQQRLASAGELAHRLATLADRREAMALQRRRLATARQLEERAARARARRPWLLAGTAALSAGLALSVWNYREAVAARDEAREQAAIADAVISFLDRDILSAGSPFSVSEHGGSRLTVREAVDRAAGKLSSRFPKDPAVEASIRATIGQVYVEDGDYGEAEAQVRQAVALGRRNPSGVDERTLRAEYGLAFALAMEQKFAEARHLLDEANGEVARRRRVTLETALRRDVINGNYLLALQDYPAAAPYFQRALAESRTADPGDVSQLAIRQTSLAWCYAALGRFAAAEPLYTIALEAVRRAEPDGGTLTGTVEERFGIGLFLAGRYAEARSMLDAGYRHLQAAIGDDGLTAEALTYLGWLDLLQGRAADAEQTLATAYRQEVASAGVDHRMALRARGCLGLAELAAGSRAAGLGDLSAAVAGYQRALGTGAPEGQLFRLLLLEAEISSGHAPADVFDQLRWISVARVSEAAPWGNWSVRLAGLRAHLPPPADR